jgi:hypothetical protein
MLACAKPLVMPSLVTRQILVVLAAKQENYLNLFYRLSTRENQSDTSKSWEDINPPYLLNQLKYSSDSYLQRDLHDDDAFERYSQMIPRNITKDAASMSLNQDEVAYDEDYDQFYSHMSPLSMQNQDHEQLEGLEMIQHDDVEPSEGLRINDTTASNTIDEFARDESISYDIAFEKLEDNEYVELEEDWEIIHQSLNRNGSAICEVCDNIDDVCDD